MSGLADELEALVAKATPGPWEIDTQRSEDCSPKHYDYLIGAPDRQGKWMTIFDSVNSDEKLIEEEYDEDYHSAWDAIGKANADLIVELVNAAPAIIAALRQPAPDALTYADGVEAAARELVIASNLVGEGPYKSLDVPIRKQCLRDAADMVRHNLAMDEAKLAGMPARPAPDAGDMQGLVDRLLKKRVQGDLDPVTGFGRVMISDPDCVEAATAIQSPTAQLATERAKVAELVEENRRALWKLMLFPIMRYLMANTAGRLDGVEKAIRHLELSTIYCEVCLGLGEGYKLNDEVCPQETIMAIHDATQDLTSFMDVRIGFPVFDKHPDYDTLAPLFFEQFLNLAEHAARALIERMKP